MNIFWLGNQLLLVDFGVSFFASFAGSFGGLVSLDGSDFASFAVLPPCGFFLKLPNPSPDFVLKTNHSSIAARMSLCLNLDN